MNINIKCINLHWVFGPRCTRVVLPPCIQCIPCHFKHKGEPHEDDDDDDDNFKFKGEHGDDDGDDDYDDDDCDNGGDYLQIS